MFSLSDLNQFSFLILTWLCVICAPSDAAVALRDFKSFQAELICFVMLTDDACTTDDIAEIIACSRARSELSIIILIWDLFSVDRAYSKFWYYY